MITNVINLSLSQCFNGLAQAYIDEILDRRPDCAYHRDNDNLLIVPNLNRVTLGLIAFKTAASELWNNVPYSLLKSKTVNMFKCGFKTHLFKISFNL